MDIPRGFRRAPLLATEEVRQARALALARHRPTIRGVFLGDLVRKAKAKDAYSDIARKFYFPFKNYPMREFLALLDDYAALCYSHLSPAQALYQMGLSAFPAFSATTLGAMVFKTTFDDPQRVLAKAARVYRLSTSHTRVHELSKGPNCYRARIENVYSEAGAYEVGAWDGALRSIGIEAKFFVRVRGLTGLEFYITW